MGGLLAAAVVATGIVLVAPAGPASAAACTWSVRKLPQLPGSANKGGAVYGTDGDTTFAGYVWGDDGLHAALWRAGALTDLGQAYGGSSRAFDVNRSGIAVGVASPELNDYAVWWNAAGVPSGLPVPAGTTNAQATAINDAGVVVGYRTTDAGEFVGMAWSVAGPVKILREYAGAVLEGVGADNRIVGTLYDGLASTAVKTRPSQSTLETLRPVVAGRSTGASGTAGTYVAGVEVTPAGSTRPVLWTSAAPKALPAPDGGSAAAVTPSGVVVGSTGATGDTSRGALWSGGTLTQLPAIGDSSRATAVNDAGGKVGGSATGVTGVGEAPVLWKCA